MFLVSWLAGREISKNTDPLVEFIGMFPAPSSDAERVTTQLLLGDAGTTDSESRKKATPKLALRRKKASLTSTTPLLSASYTASLRGDCKPV